MLRQAVAADHRIHRAITDSVSDVRALESDVTAPGLPSTIAQTAEQAGYSTSDLGLLRATIVSESSSVTAGMSFPVDLTNPQIAAYDTRNAASWRQFAAGTCPLTTVLHVWSGEWTDSFGAIGFRYVSPSEGSADVAQYGAQKLGCAADADYYRGGYNDGPNDNGKQIACTQGSAGHLMGRYVPDTGQAPGDFDIHYNGGSPATWSGTFKAHFGGDGCCTAS